MAMIRNQRLRFIAIFVAIIVIIILLHGIGALKPVENLVFLIINPIQKAVYPLGVNFFATDNILKIDQLRTANKQLEKKLTQLTIENAKLQTAAANSQIIAEELNYLHAKQQNGVIAHLVSKSAEGQRNVIMIDQGSGAGIKEGYAVVAREGIIIGKILIVYSHSAQVLLLTDNASRLAAKVLNNQLSPGVITGKHGLGLLMELIPQNEEVTSGHIVVTSGIEPNIPSDLVVGAIDSIHSEQEELFQSATISLSIPYERLTVVMVIIPPPHDE